MSGSAGPAVRLGVAVPIPQPYASDLDAARAAAGDPQAASVPAHLTLLGPTEVAPMLLPAVESHLAAVARRQAAYPVQLRGTGTFRPVTEVVFIAVAAGAGECETLASAVRSGPLERKLPFPYHPHVTVAHDVASAALDRVYQQMAAFEAKFMVDQFTLYVHTRDGHWRVARTFPLVAAASL